MPPKKQTNKATRAAQEKLTLKLDEEFSIQNSEKTRPLFAPIDEIEIKKLSKTELIDRLRLANKTAPKAPSQSENSSDTDSEDEKKTVKKKTN